MCLGHFLIPLFSAIGKVMITLRLITNDEEHKSNARRKLIIDPQSTQISVFSLLQLKSFSILVFRDSMLCSST